MGTEVAIDSFSDDLIKGRILDAFSLKEASDDGAFVDDLMQGHRDFLRWQKVQGSSSDVYSHCY